MNKQDLDALANLYREVYYPQDVEQLDEGVVDLLGLPQSFPGSSSSTKAMLDKVRREKESQRKIDATNQRAQLGVVKTNKGYVVKPGTNLYDTEKYSQGLKLANRLNKETGLGKRPTPGANNPPPKPNPPGANNPPPRPAASSTVLAKKGGVEGRLDKATGKYTAGAFSDTEKSRYASVAAQNAAKNSVSSTSTPKPPTPTTPKPPTPAIGKLGNTSFERRTPTSAELRAAQAERATQKASGQDTSSVKNAEKALQSAQKTNLSTTGPTPAIINKSEVEASKLNFKPRDMTKYPLKQSYEWPSAKTIRDIADAYSSIYEGKKKDQDQDGDNDFADVRIARMIASGMSKAEAIAAVKNKEYNEEFELDEATRMRKELGKEGEIATRKELAARSKAYKRSGSVDRTIAAAERGADRPYIKHKRDESDSDRKKREERQSKTLRGLAASRRGSVRDKPRAGLRGYAAKVEGGDKDLQTSRQKAMSAGTLTPKEKKQLGEVYEIVASYLLENNFAATINDANVIIENMSEVWLSQILESAE
jgi:hypothetical protein